MRVRWRTEWSSAPQRGFTYLDLVGLLAKLNPATFEDMEMMLKSLNVDFGLLGWDRVDQKWE
jgi:hypothetical protein